MSLVASMAAMAVLFIAFGFLRPRRECHTDGGCAGCGVTCHRRGAGPEEAP